MAARIPRWLRVAGAVPTYARLFLWGCVSPGWGESRPLVVVQAVIRAEEGVLLAVRSDLWGWELPGGEWEEGETHREALLREVREETGLEVEVVRRVGDYVRTGFRPHTARVYICRPVGGELRTSHENRRLAWFPEARLPDTLFPWYRQPLEDALTPDPTPAHREEHQGVAAILAGMTIDLAMRWADDRCGGDLEEG